VYKTTALPLSYAPILLGLVEFLYQARANPRPRAVAGITFPNCVGLAAGFDKGAEVLPALQVLGFGHAEIGTVVPRLQKGNNRPRMFRYARRLALLNRMGFNSEGVATVAARLRYHKDRVRIPVIGSLGKMKETQNADAAEDYKTVLRELRGTGAIRAYAANVSSPNTKGLRELQGGKYLESLVSGCVRLDHELSLIDHEPTIPLFVKIAPDLTEADVEETVGAAIAGGARGLIATNTSNSLEIKMSLGTQEEGGVSGGPLTQRARAILVLVKKYAPNVPVISVGGIMDKDEAKVRLDLGADLVQLYSGFIFRGPKLISEIRPLS
jgi:dihydroorotate dehydrogenase